MNMNKLGLFISGVIVLIAYTVFSQDNRTLVTVGEEEITVDEFMYVYKKNNVQGESMDKKSVEEYLDLYVNFKLKVREAENLGYDTVQAFIDELAGYRKQLAEPYFVNEEIMDELLDEAYERKQLDLRASHILIQVGPNAMPSDTLAAYNKAMNARNRILNGAPFGQVAMEVSDDPSARDRQSPRNNKTIPGNKGDLGYFSVFDMVYPFETGAYNTMVGEVSQPVRTDFGYHIIKVTDRIPAQGSIEAAHLYLQMPDSASASDSASKEKEAMDIYNLIKKEDSDWDAMVKQYSDDKGSAARGGILPAFDVNRMVPEFIEAISHMSDSGEISKPVLTSYGWHIIKLIKKSGVPTFEEAKNDLRKRLEKDKRAQKSKEIIIEDIKKEYGYEVYQDGLEQLYSVVDSSIYNGKWAVPETADLSEPVMKIGDTTRKAMDLARFMVSRQNIGKNENRNEFVNKTFKEFSDEQCRAYEDGQLENKYPEFRAIVKEYRDGILLFELTNEKVWAYASKDTVGLETYYEAHKKDFMWDTRLDASIYTVNDTNYVDAIRKMIEKGKSDEEIEEELGNDTLNIVRIERKKFQKDENATIDGIKWKKGLTDARRKGLKIEFVRVYEKISPQPKSFEEARGLITAGYQEQLEEEWIEELRAKYPVEIEQEVLESVTE
jgi:peptidyl-prolyl cis-trans isomerase SurA